MQVTNVVFNSTASPGDKTIIDPPAEERKIIVDLLKEEKVAEATRYSEGLITAYPRSFMLFYSLGMSCLLLDEAEKARVYLKRATKLNPGVADPWRCLGEAYLKLELNADARRCFDQALQLNPDDPASRRGMTQSIIDPADFDVSVETLEKMVTEDPDHPHLLMALGQCFVEQEKYIRSIDALEKAAGLMPEDTSIMAAVGQAYAEFNQPDEALQWFNRVLDHKPPRPQLLSMMANAARTKGEFELALDYANQAIALNPDGAGPKNTLASIHATLGDKKKAIEVIEDVLTQHPDNIEAMIELVITTMVKKDDPAYKALEDAYKIKPENHFAEKQKTRVGFALGKAYGDTNQYAKSIRVLKEVNAKRREFLGFDLENEVRSFELVKHVFDPITPDDCVEANPNDRQMIFILGMPRSGTTLTEQIIASHSQVYGGGELNFMNEETAELMYMFGLQPDVQLKKVAFEHIRRNYLGHIDSLKVGERFITDKMPHNFLRLGYILAAFPEAKVIHLNRDPVAVCLSCFQKLFPARGMGFTFDLRDLGLYYGMYLDLMQFWRDKFPGRILDLDYKTLTEDQEGQTRMLLDYCGLPWEDQCLEFYNTRRGVLTASQIQVRDKMYQGSSDVWKKYRRHLGELLDALDEAGVKYG